MICPRHSQQTLTQICVHKPCTRKFELICPKCRSQQHSGHSAKVFPLTEFAKILNRFQKSVQQQKVGDVRLIIHEQLKMVEEFRGRVEECDKEMVGIWRGLIGCRERYKERRQEILGKIQSSVEGIKGGDSDVGGILKELESMAEYNNTKSKLVLIDPEIKCAEQREQELMKELRHCESSIREYLMKIIEVFLQGDQDKREQDQKGLLGEYLLERFNMCSSHMLRVREERRSIGAQLITLFPDRKGEVILADKNEKRVEEFERENGELRGQMGEEIRLREVVSKENKNLKQEIKKCRAQIPTKVKEYTDKILAKEAQYLSLEKSHSDLTLQLSTLNASLAEIQSLQTQVNTLSHESTQHLNNINTLTHQLNERQALIATHILQIDSLKKQAINLNERIGGKQVILNRLEEENQKLRMGILRETLRQNPESKPFSMCQNTQTPKQKAHNQTDVKVIIKLLNKVMGDMNLLEGRVKEHQTAELVYQKQLEIEKALVSKLNTQLSNNKRKTSLSRTKSQLLSLCKQYTH